MKRLIIIILSSLFCASSIASEVGCFVDSEVASLVSVVESTNKKLTISDVKKLKKTYYNSVKAGKLEILDQITTGNSIFRLIPKKHPVVTESKLEYLLTIGKGLRNGVKYISVNITNEKVKISDNGLWAKYEADIVEKAWQAGKYLEANIHESSYVVLENGKAKYAALCIREYRPITSSDPA